MQAQQPFSLPGRPPNPAELPVPALRGAKQYQKLLPTSEEPFRPFQLRTRETPVSRAALQPAVLLLFFSCPFKKG
jgi:hypothetical protein